MVNDRIPLYICARNGSKWHPEYRLHALWIPVLVIYPAGLGIFGANLHDHWHYLWLVLGTFLVSFSGVSGVPACVDYVIEAFSPRYANDATAITNFYRFIFGIPIPFFLFPWANRVDVQWVFGMMVFFTIFTFSMILAVMVWGRRLRELSFVHVDGEDGLTVVKDKVGAKMKRRTVMCIRVG